MGASRGMVPIMVTLAIITVGCGGDSNAGVTAKPATASGGSHDGSGGLNPSWCRSAIDDLIASGLVAVDDGVGLQRTGQPAYAVDACYWSAAALFVGRQLSPGSLDYHRTKDEMIGPWKDLPGLGEAALVSVGVDLVFWIRGGREYAIGADGDYCYMHKECKSELSAAAKLIDQRLAGG